MFQQLSASIRHNAHIIFLCISWYFISSLASQVTKQVLTVCPLPLFLGEFQFIYTAVLAWFTCYIAYSFPGFYRIFPNGTFPEYYIDDRETSRAARKESKLSSLIIPPSNPILQTVLPLGLFQFVGKYFGHTATLGACFHGCKYKNAIPHVYPFAPKDFENIHFENYFNSYL